MKLKGIFLALLGPCALALAFCLVLPGTGVAQTTLGIAALVNDEPISEYDVQMRMRLIVVSTRQRPNEKMRKQVIQQLIDERLMMQEGKRLQVTISDEEVNSALTRMAKRSKMSLEQFSKALKQIGVDVRTLTDKITAELSWRQAIQRRFGRSIRIQDSELDREIDKNNPLSGQQFYEVELQQIMLLFTGRPTQGQVRARLRDAQYIRSRFKSCDTVRTTAAGIKDVVFNKLPPQSTANIADPKMREVLNKSEPGAVLEPRASGQGIEIFAVCAKREIGSKEAARAKTRVSLLNQQFAQLARRHLHDLRQDAVIDIR